MLCAYAPQFVSDSARVGWDQDAGAFSAWLAAFNQVCSNENVISAARLPLELCEHLKTGSAERPPILLAGFDRILPSQLAFISAWGEDDRVLEATLGAPTEHIQFHAAADSAAELSACALWAKAQLVANPQVRLLVITQDARTRRGEIERAFLRYRGASESPSAATNLLEFSLGVPLSQVALARSAQLLLHWLGGSIGENELDWLLATGHIATSPDESRALLSFMRALRRRGLQRSLFTLAEFLRQRAQVKLPDGGFSHDASTRSPSRLFATAVFADRLGRTCSAIA